MRVDTARLSLLDHLQYLPYRHFRFFFPPPLPSPTTDRPIAAALCLVHPHSPISPSQQQQPPPPPRHALHARHLRTRTSPSRQSLSGEDTPVVAPVIVRYTHTAVLLDRHIHEACVPNRVGASHLLSSSFSRPSTAASNPTSYASHSISDLVLLRNIFIARHLTRLLDCSPARTSILLTRLSLTLRSTPSTPSHPTSSPRRSAQPSTLRTRCPCFCPRHQYYLDHEPSRRGPPNPAPTT